jgi:hypothetical protein
MNPHKYQKLLAEALPVVIRTEAKYKRLLKIARGLMEKPEEEITEEEGRLLELLAVLIETYEDRVYPLPKGDQSTASPSTVSPEDMLAALYPAEAEPDWETLDLDDLRWETWIEKPRWNGERGTCMGLTATGTKCGQHGSYDDNGKRAVRVSILYSRFI